MERHDENRAYTELKCGDNISYILNRVQGASESDGGMLPAQHEDDI